MGGADKGQPQNFVFVSVRPKPCGIGHNLPLLDARHGMGGTMTTGIHHRESGDGDDSGRFAGRIRKALIWRSGSQIAVQLVSWTSTFFVIRLLDPADYGLFAMTQVVLSLMNLLNGYSFTGALVQADRIGREQVAQVFGVLLLLNGSLAIGQFLLAPLAASYFRTPEVADLLRVQALLYLATPFIMIPQALLSRRIDFVTQARVNIGAALLAAIVAPACALAGLGVWTLVIAPLTLFGARAIGLMILGRWWIAPSFRLRGSGKLLGFGTAMLASQLLWFVQTQADIFIAGRHLPAHQIGLYSTALFLTQIFASKFVPALNDVAFPAYARMQDDPERVAEGFVRAAGLVMLAAIPFSLGMATTADPLVRTVLGEKWAEAIPLVRLIGFAMPFVTLQILYAPATNALGRPGIAAWVSGAGAIIMPTAFLIGVDHGPIGLAYAWLFGFPLLTLVATILSLPVIGVRPGRLLARLWPLAVAGGAMALAVLWGETALGHLAPLPRLALLVPLGAASYMLVLLGIARPLVREAIMLVRQPPAAPAV